MDGIGIECVLAGAQATSVIDRASSGRQRLAKAGSSRGGRAQGDGRCDGDNEDARRCDDETKICRTGEVDIGRRRAVATDRLCCLGEAEPWARA